MATSLFFMSTDQNSGKTPTELLRYTNIVNGSGQIRTEPQKSRGRKPGSKTGQKKQKKERQRGPGIARLEREIRALEEKNKIVAAVGDTIPNNPTRLPVSVDPVLVLLGFPSSLGGCRSNKSFCGGAGSGEIMINPVCSPWGFVETSAHELSSIPNPKMYYASKNRWDTCIKKKRLEEDQNLGESNGGGFSKYVMNPPPLMNSYNHLPQPDQRNQRFFLDHRIARSSAPPSSPYLNEATNHTGTAEEFGSYMEENPRNGSGGVKEYEFFPGKHDDFPGIHGTRVSLATSVVGECSPNSSSTIDLSLKL